MKLVLNAQKDKRSIIFFRSTTQASAKLIAQITAMLYNDEFWIGLTNEFWLAFGQKKIAKSCFIWNVQFYIFVYSIKGSINTLQWATTTLPK